MSTARAAVRGLEGELNGHLGEVELLVTELVTNAVRHPACEQDEISLSFVCTSDLLHAEVRDRGQGFEPPEGPEPGTDATSGWGLTMLDTLAVGWGVRADPHTTVWFDLALSDDGAFGKLAA